jgi:hypothetical protein
LREATSGIVRLRLVLRSCISSSTPNPSSTETARSRRNSVIEQDSELIEDAKALPPFFELTNDEDRELKASTRLPGTYHLVVNPTSFLSMEED